MPTAQPPMNTTHALGWPTNQTAQPQSPFQPQDSKLQMTLVNIMTILLAAATLAVGCLHYWRQRRVSAGEHRHDEEHALEDMRDQNHRTDSDIVAAVLGTASRTTDEAADTEQEDVNSQPRNADGVNNIVDVEATRPGPA